MTDQFEIIAAFVDGERVDPAALKAALVEPAGRDYLADLVALREVIAHESPAVAVASRPGRRWLVAAAAAVLLSLGGGFALGHRLANSSPESSIGANAAAPAPTRVIEVSAGTSYVSQGGK
jgi:hypothetical protein